MHTDAGDGLYFLNIRSVVQRNAAGLYPGYPLFRVSVRYGAVGAV